MSGSRRSNSGRGSRFIRRPAVAAVFAELAAAVQRNGFLAAPDTGDLFVSVHAALLLLHPLLLQRRGRLHETGSVAIRPKPKIRENVFNERTRPGSFEVPLQRDVSPLVIVRDGFRVQDVGPKHGGRVRVTPDVTARSQQSFRREDTVRACGVLRRADVARSGGRVRDLLSLVTIHASSSVPHARRPDIIGERVIERSLEMFPLQPEYVV